MCWIYLNIVLNQKQPLFLWSAHCFSINNRHFNNYSNSNSKKNKSKSHLLNAACIFQAFFHMYVKTTLLSDYYHDFLGEKPEI